MWPGVATTEQNNGYLTGVATVGYFFVAVRPGSFGEISQNSQNTGYLTSASGTWATAFPAIRMKSPRGGQSLQRRRLSRQVRNSAFIASFKLSGMCACHPIVSERDWINATGSRVLRLLSVGQGSWAMAALKMKCFSNSRWSEIAWQWRLPL